MKRPRSNVFVFTLFVVGILMPFLAFAAESPPCESPAGVIPNPLGCVDSLPELVISVTKALIGFVAIAATFMFVYGGIMMLISGGNVEQVKRSKAVLKYTTISLVILFLTTVILRFVFTVLAPDYFSEDVAQQLGLVGLPNADLSSTAARIILTVLGLLGIAATAMMVYGGYTWLTASGNEQRVEKAKRILYSAVIGLIIILLSWAIIRFVVFTTTNVAK